MSTEFADPLRTLYLDWVARMQADPEMSVQVMRDMQEGWHTVATEPKGVSYESVDIDGLSAVWSIPADADPTTVVLYFHGGGFITGSAHSHRKMAGHLARKIGSRVLLVDYRRAPEHAYPAQVDDGVTAFRWLIDQGFAPNRIVSAGDSAGGTLALALVVSLRTQGLPTPGAVVTFSPGLDWDGEWMVNEENDILASKAIIVAMGSLAFGDRSTKDPLCNPTYADLTGFPPVYLSAGGHENLLGGIRKFVEAADAAGVEVTLDIAPSRQHVHTFAVGNDPEADRTITESAAWARERLA
ncbi:alpha/beta hydrolase [Rhodococcus sp. WB9]|uniref:alpha/beta hydrolase n=1 Tax=Rhodococcus sp. WB9 TaxID=2594007 RepID=UPI0011869E79|nr:alpha/beta hydrolase [Rhodococcus sp. WB9]QDQ95096.1 alpha/beta hydrolase [Rhodococcus sp. WB9]